MAMMEGCMAECRDGGVGNGFIEARGSRAEGRCEEAGEDGVKRGEFGSIAVSKCSRVQV